MNLSMSTYKDDYNGFYMPRNFKNSSTYTGSFPWAAGLVMFKYISSAKTFLCPSAKSVFSNDNIVGSGRVELNPTNWYRYNYLTYGYSTYLGANQESGAPVYVKDSRIRNPSGKIMLADNWLTGNPSGGVTYAALNAEIPGTQPAMAIINDRHNNAANILWTDGHASLEPRASWNFTGRLNAGASDPLGDARRQFWNPKYRNSDYRSNY